VEECKPLLAGQYKDWLKRGINVVTPNKKANSGPLKYYQAVAYTPPLFTST